MQHDDSENFSERKVYLVNPEDVEGEFAEHDLQDEDGAPERPSGAESRAAAEVAVFLEDDLGVDPRRLYIRVKGAYIYIQGTVETDEQLAEIEEMLPQRPGIKGFEHRIRVQSGGELD